MSGSAGRTPPEPGRFWATVLVGDRMRYGCLTAAMISRTALGVVTPALVALTVDAVLTGGDAVPVVGLLAAVLLLAATSEAVMVWLSAVCVGNGTARLRIRLFDRLLAVGPRSSLGHGDAVTRVTRTTAVSASAPMTVVDISVQLLASLVALAALWWIDWRAGLACLIALPVAYLLARRFVGTVAELFGRYQEIQGTLASRLVAALTGAQTIRASGTLRQETERVLTPLPELERSGREIWGAQRSSSWRFGLLTPLIEVVVIIVLGWGVAAGRVSAGGMLAAIAYLKLALAVLDQIDSFFELGQARSGTQRVREALAIPAPRYGRRAAAGGGEVRLRGVRVDGVLDRVDLLVPPGSSLALVGASGSGKTVLANLLGRLTDPDDGEVLVDGVPVAELSREQLRRTVTYAFAEPVLIGATVREAIGLESVPGAGEEVSSAARTARADGFIRKLPAGYDTDLIATPMSGGERQRVGLARAVARNARVYVLDDPTSGLDTVTESEVVDALTSALTGRTRIVVAHRARTAQRCDLVAWLADGKIRGCAPHAQLWRDPEYRALFRVPEGEPLAEAAAEPVGQPPQEELTWVAR